MSENVSSSVLDDEEVEDDTSSAMDTAEDNDDENTPTSKKPADEATSGMTTEEEEEEDGDEDETTSTPKHEEVDDDDDDETASENDDDNGGGRPMEVEAEPVQAVPVATAPPPVPPPPPPVVSKPPPKMRIKLSLKKKLPSMKLPMAKPAATSSHSDATQAPSPSKKPKLFQKSLPISRSATGTGSRRRPVVPSKMVKLPPILSPGFSTSAAIFQSTMAEAGYTWERRVEHPHRGSSVTRTVGDLFDTDVHLSLKRIRLAPEGYFVESDLFQEQPKKPSNGKNDTKDADKKKKGDSPPTKPNTDAAKQALEKNGKAPDTAVKPEPSSILTGSNTGVGSDVNGTVPKVKEANNSNYKEPSSDMTNEVAIKQHPSNEEKDGPVTVQQESKDVEMKDAPPSPKPEAPTKQEHSNGERNDSKEATPKLSLAELLLKKLGPAKERPRKRQRPITFKEMVPVSLTLPYPESYVERRLQYLKKVRERELAIIAHQEAQETIDMEDENSNKPNPVVIPPIPDKPAPPTVEELNLKGSGYEYLMAPNSEKGPIVIPEPVSGLVSHLDKSCFHISQGRYFGLQTNTIADPTFVGPSALGSTTTYSGGGLATATTSTTTSTSGLNGGGMTMILSVGFHSAAAIPATKDAKHEKPKKANKDAPKEEKKDKSSKQPQQEARTSALPVRSIMEGDKTDQATKDKFRDCILRAMVHAIRSNTPPGTFRGPNGGTYDLGKSFAMYSRVKPCQKCRNNKQGVLHCRIKRKHLDPDHDGGSSIDLLKAFSDVPLESLLVKEEKVVLPIKGDTPSQGKPEQQIIVSKKAEEQSSKVKTEDSLPSASTTNTAAASSSGPMPVAKQETPEAPPPPAPPQTTS